MTSELTQFVPSMPIVFAAFVIVQILVVVSLSVAVLLDANARRRRDAGLFLRSPALWFWVVLATGGYLATLAYWIIHYSAFRYHGEGRD